MTRAGHALIAIALSTGALGWVQPPVPRTDDRGNPVLTVHSDLVVLHVTVLDNKKGYVGGLTQEAFTVYEDGQPQTVSFFRNEDSPVTVGLVVDNSGSMHQKRNGVIAAALTFARSSNREDEMFLVNFNENVTTGLPAGVPFTSDLTVLRSALGTIGANGRTALYDALAFGLDHLARGSHQKRVLIAVSDGSDNASQSSYDDLLRRAKSSNVVIYTIGVFEEYDEDANPKVLKALATATGGQSFFPKDPDSVRRVLERIAVDIRSGYTLGYAPTNMARDGKFRRVLVRVRTGGHAPSVRTRPGYYAANDTAERGGMR
jgi:Ca-activated chloride channel homolog